MLVKEPMSHKFLDLSLAFKVSIASDLGLHWKSIIPMYIRELRVGNIKLSEAFEYQSMGHKFLDFSLIF